MVKELNPRDDDNRELKKEIIRLKILSGPASNKSVAVNCQPKKKKNRKQAILCSLAIPH